MNNGGRSKLNDDDVRAIVRLLGAVAEGKGDAAAKRRPLMDGLAKLVGADGWLWTMTRLDPADNTPVSVGVIHDGLSQEQIAAWLESSQATDPPLPEHAPLGQITMAGKHFTRTRQQLVSDDSYYSNPTVQRYRLDVGLDHFLYTIYPLGPGVISGIGLYRKTGTPPFSQRDAKIAHILTSEIPWLHAAGLPGDGGHDVPQLTRRLRSVLVLLLDSHTRKEIAALLKISPNTVRDHMDAIYRHFNVKSHLELMRRFKHGDGGDQLG